jgi:rSAM/selenodomain-associated transferase 2
VLLSIVIPCYNEEDHIGPLLDYLRTSAESPEQIDICVVDGGSTDQTIKNAEAKGARIIHSAQGRAVQMNAGADQAQGEILYFLHADSLPPLFYDRWIRQGWNKHSRAGCFRLRFDKAPLFMQGFAWLSRVNHPICRGGDQSLYIDKVLFQEMKGFNENYRVYEDCEFTGRLYRKTRFSILSKPITTSTRKYRLLGWVYLQYHFGMIHWGYYTKKSPEQLAAYYQANIQNKLNQKRKTLEAYSSS